MRPETFPPLKVQGFCSGREVGLELTPHFDLETTVKSLTLRVNRGNQTPLAFEVSHPNTATGAAS